MSIKVVYSTMGQSSPSTVADDAGRTGGYLYKGDPKRTPDHPDYEPLAEREPGPSAPAAESNRRRKAERLAAFAAHLAELTPVMGKDAALIEAGRRVGVGDDTAHAYERELRRQGEGEA